MFDRVLDVLVKFGADLLPFVVVVAYQNIGILRFGKYHRTLAPGFHWKIPFIEDGYPENVVPTTIRLQPQTLTTRDDVSVVVEGVVRYRVTDVEAFITKIYDQRDLLLDTSMGAVLKQVRLMDFADLATTPPENKIASEIRRQVKDYGVSIDNFTFTDLGRIRSIRIIAGSPLPNLDN